MAIVYGFEELRKLQITELRTEARLFRHVKTGAELISLVNDDENKVFGIAFRTPPRDSTGIAHILEHSVLCGSRKYPVKEPFVELLKGSLKTFLNAFTYPDKTCYPVASQNVRDFYNLIDVYLDAVFYPRLTPWVLKQEGWHLDIEKPEDPLAFKGVVYNEMKGAYSSPDSVLAEYSQQSLFTDNTYGLDSGGDPRIIPDLTFDRFKTFHEKLYHPSNARIYFYGDDDPEERLRFVNEYLKDFERIDDIDSEVRLQPHFPNPKHITRPFAAEEGGKKGMFTINWLLTETTNPEMTLALHILEYILLGMPGSPLRKALIDSGLGEDIAGVGLEADLRQMYFSTGLKGIDVKDAPRIESLIFQTLSRLSVEGVDPGTIEAAVNTIEFRLRENNSGSLPRGLLLMLRALRTWLYGGDPFVLLAFEAPLEELKARVNAGEGLFESLIDRFFLNNTHYTTLLLKPDPELGEREAAAERARLKKIREGFSAEQLQSVIDETHELRRMQERPDPPESLAKIPSLTRDDLARENKTIPSELTEQNDTRMLCHDLFTNGILYLDLGFDLHLLPQKYLPYIPLFGRGLIEMGTEAEDYATFTQRISRKTGGIRPDFFTSSLQREARARLQADEAVSHADGGTEATAWMFLRGKSMVAQADDLLNIFRDMFLTVRLDNRERFRQMVLEEKARQEQKLVPSGHQIVNLRLRSHFSEADWAAEQMHGLSYLMFVRRLARDVEEDWNGVLNVLEEIRQTLVNRRGMFLNATLDGADRSQFEPLLKGFLGDLPSAPVSGVKWTPDAPPPFEGMTIPAQVNYVGKGANLFQSGYRFHGSTMVITRYLRNTWLWERVRVQGGAYGSFCMFDRFSGTLTFVSYRDPNLLKTIENFDRAADFLRSADLNEDELAKAVIGTIGDIDTHMLPDTKGYVSMLRHLTGDSDEIRQRMREEVLATTAEDFKAFADELDAVRERGLVKVLGAQGAIEESITHLGEWMQIFKVL